MSYFNGNAAKIYYDSANYFFAGTDPVGGGTVGGRRLERDQLGRRDPDRPERR